MTRHHLELVPIVLVSSVLYSTVATAQTASDQAAALYKEGIDLYFAQDYGLAIAKLRAGYDLDPNPMFLYTLSLCFYRLGNYEEARNYALAADNAGGMSPQDTTNNRARLLAFDVRLSTQALGASPQPAPQCSTDAECNGGTCDAGLCVLPEVARAEVSSGGGLGALGYTGIGATAVGVGLLVGAGVTSLAVARNQEDLATIDPSDRSGVDELMVKINTNKNLGKFMLIGGAGLTTVGVALVVIDLVVVRKPATTAVLSPVLLSGGGGLAFTRRF